MDILDLIPVKARWPLLIAAIGAATLGGWWELEAHAADIAEKTTQATVNKAMVDGARQAASDAVKDALKEQLPLMVKEVAQATAKAIVEEQTKASQAKPVVK
jgi:hypothetical protein